MYIGERKVQSQKKYEKTNSVCDSIGETKCLRTKKNFYIDLINSLFP